MTALGIPKRNVALGNIPSEEELQRFDEYLRGKTEDKVRLQGIFHTTRLAVVAIMEEMGLTPELEFEEQVLDGTTFQLSTNNMAMLKVSVDQP